MQGCSVGLADAKLSPFNDITLFDTKTLRTKVSASQVQTSMTLLVTLASYILASLCSCSAHTFARIYNNYTFSLENPRNHLSSLSLCFASFS